MVAARSVQDAPRQAQFGMMSTSWPTLKAFSRPFFLKKNFLRFFKMPFLALFCSPENPLSNQKRVLV